MSNGLVRVYSTDIHNARVWNSAFDGRIRSTGDIRSQFLFDECVEAKYRVLSL
jgi:hypothetical protein